MATTFTVRKIRIGEGGWEPYPMPPGCVRSGDPEARVRWLRVSGPGEPAYYAGLWSARPSIFEWRFDLDETLHVLEGRVVVTLEGGDVLDLGPGDVASFPRGAVTTWDIREPFRKVFVDS